MYAVVLTSECRNLFLFLWLPVLQTSLDRWVKLKNEAQKRKDRRIELSTGFSLNFLYSTPEYFGTEDLIVPVPATRLTEIYQEHYPDHSEMFQQTPLWFHQAATTIMDNLEL